MGDRGMGKWGMALVKVRIYWVRAELLTLFALIYRLEHYRAYEKSDFTGPAQQLFEWGGGGGGLESQTSKTSQLAGYGPPEYSDFNSSQMPRNAFKINQRNP